MRTRRGQGPRIIQWIAALAGVCAAVFPLWATLGHQGPGRAAVLYPAARHQALAFLCCSPRESSSGSAASARALRTLPLPRRNPRTEQD